MILGIVLSFLLNPVLSDSSFAAGSKRAEEGKVSDSHVLSKRTVIGVGYYDPDAASFVARLERALTFQNYFKVTSMRSRKNVLREQAVQQLGLTDNSVEIGYLLGAQKVLRVEKNAAGYTVRLLDVKTGEIENVWPGILNPKSSDAEGELITQIMAELTGESLQSTGSVVQYDQVQQQNLEGLSLEGLELPQVGLLKLTSNNKILLPAKQTRLYFGDRDKYALGVTGNYCEVFARDATEDLRVFPAGVSFVISDIKRDDDFYYLNQGDGFIIKTIRCYSKEGEIRTLGELRSVLGGNFTIESIGAKIAR